MNADYPSVATSSNPVVEHPDQVIVDVPPQRRGPVALAVVGFIAVSLALLLVVIYLFAVLGPAALFYAAILALIPLVVVLLGIRWIDRWEPEPRVVLLFAFLWGAAMAIFIALVFSGITEAYVARHGLGKSGAADFFESVIQAPIVEETAKGLGILLILLVVRKYFDGPVDGIVYGATIAVGFAFSENLQYFGLAIADNDGIGQTFLLRAVLSPFAHVMFTSATGLALGYAARHSNRKGAIGYFILGLIPAMLLHAFWNSATYWATDWFTYYFLVQVPLFILAIIGVVLLRRHDQRLTKDRLTEYEAAGWFTPSEVNQLSTAAGRRQVVAWAKSHALKREYKKFVQDATHLALTRQKLISGKDKIGSQRYEAQLLDSVVADRAALATLPPLLTQSGR